MVDERMEPYAQNPGDVLRRSKEVDPAAFDLELVEGDLKMWAQSAKPEDHQRAAQISWGLQIAFGSRDNALMALKLIRNALESEKSEGATE